MNDPFLVDFDSPKAIHGSGYFRASKKHVAPKSIKKSSNRQNYIETESFTKSI